MTSTTHRPECSAAAVYVGIELGAKEWLLTLGTGPGGRVTRVRLRPGDRAGWQRAVTTVRRRAGLGPEALVRSCYEAGRDGCWPHRFLTACGVVNLVVDSSSIEVSRRARRAKTDRLDGERLLRLLLRHWGGERGMWQVVTVPSEAVEDARHASRTLTMLQRERTRLRNQIHGLLALRGVRVRLDGRFRTRLETTRDWDGAPVPPHLRARVLVVWQQLDDLEPARRAARQAERRAVQPARGRAATRAQRLAQVRAVAARTATILDAELFSRGLRNRRQVGALTGLVPAPYRSGTITRDHGVGPGGVPAVRRIAVELAWAWLRYQPTSALTQWYRHRFGRGGPTTQRIGIVALARRVIIALWRYSETGVLPAGAQLKA